MCILFCLVLLNSVLFLKPCTFWLSNQVKQSACGKCMFQHMEFCVRRKEGNVLFNNALNTFYLWLYGVRHMIKDHSDSEKGNPLPPHRLLLSINSKGSFICTIPHRIAHTTAFVTPVVEHWLERLHIWCAVGFSSSSNNDPLGFFHTK